MNREESRLYLINRLLEETRTINTRSSEGCEEAVEAAAFADECASRHAD